MLKREKRRCKKYNADLLLFSLFYGRFDFVIKTERGEGFLIFRYSKVFRRLGGKKYLYYLTNIENIQNYLYENRQID